MVLPFETDIPIRSYLDHALPLSIVVHDSQHVDALFGSFVQLFFPDDKLDYDRVLMLPSLRTSEWERLGFLETQLLDTHSRALGRAEGLLDALVHHLGRGDYVEAQIDEYFLPTRPCYLSAHSVHDNMLVGYDLARRVFLIAGYGADYEVAEAGFDDVARAFFDVPLTQRRRRLLRLIRRRHGATGGFDLAGMAAQLDDYLGSRATMSPAAMREARLYWKARRFTGSWGLNAYGALIDYITRVARDGRPLDLRVTRTLWEHKACMLARIRYLEAKGHVDRERSLSRAYAPIERLAKSIRFAAYEYNASGRTHLPTDAIVDSLHRMKEGEAAVLGRLLTALPLRARLPRTSSRESGRA